MPPLRSEKSNTVTIIVKPSKLIFKTKKKELVVEGAGCRMPASPLA